MKLTITPLRLISILLFTALTLSVKAQRDTTRLRFSEETLKDPGNKNVRWVQGRKRQYNMDNVPSLLKIGTSPLYGVASFVSRSYDSFFLDIGFEKKIPRTQLSLELRIRSLLGDRDGSGYFSHYFFTDDFTTNQRSTIEIRNNVGVDLLVRFYLLKGRRIRQGKSGDNPYGMYLFAAGFNLATWGQETETVFDLDLGYSQPYRVIERKGLNSGPAHAVLGVGYQQRFLKKGYIDISGGVSRIVDKREDFLPVQIYLDLTLGYSIFKIR